LTSLLEGNGDRRDRLVLQRACVPHASGAPDATLVFMEGKPRVAAAEDVDTSLRGALRVVSREELRTQLGDEPVTATRLDQFAAASAVDTLGG
jgi:hypothetical protein